MDLSLDNVINVSIAETPVGIGRYNTSNLSIFTTDVYSAETFGTLGYKIYLEPTEVGIDFGTNSDTYQQALAIFSQQPNILAGGGYLVIIPLIVEVQTIAFSANAASGTFVLNYGGHASAAINWNDTASQVQTKLQAVQGLSAATVAGTINSSVGLTVTFNEVYGNISLITATSNSLMSSVPAAITITIAQSTAGETLGGAVTRTVGLVQYFGILINQNFADNADLLTTAAVVQAVHKMLFAASTSSASVAPGGAIDLLRTGGFTHTRGLYYGATSATDPNLAAVLEASAYAGRLLSVDFTGSNTTLNMNLKDLATVQPDGTMTQTLFELCQAAGADVYASIQGVPKVLCSGTNSFVDQIYNQLAFAGDLQVAGFNYLAETSTKIPQTEAGVSGYKGAFRQVCEQYVTNQYIAPGVWNSPVTFGNQADFIANVAQVGYYIYSQPIAQQSQASRAAREFPAVQIAIKEAGAGDKGNVIVNINP